MTYLCFSVTELNYVQSAELQITVGRQTMSDEILTLDGHYVRTNIFYQVISKQR